MCYSQDGEDKLLLSFYEGNWKMKGFYVDIGAYHPIYFSNTKLFYDMGWKGINIDANPEAIKKFDEARKRDINIQMGVSDTAGELNYYVIGKESTGNSFSEQLIEKRGNKIEDIIKIKVKPINEILDDYLPRDQHIDFITIDVEDFEWRIIKTFNFDKYAPDFFLIEELEYKNRDFMEGITPTD
jgi:FkbM family methyltransferase